MKTRLKARPNVVAIGNPYLSLMWIVKAEILFKWTKCLLKMILGNSLNVVDIWLLNGDVNFAFTFGLVNFFFLLKILGSPAFMWQITIARRSRLQNQTVSVSFSISIASGAMTLHKFAVPLFLYYNMKKIIPHDPQPYWKKQLSECMKSTIVSALRNHCFQFAFFGSC